jgi:hypothetical protein
MSPETPASSSRSPSTTGTCSSASSAASSGEARTRSLGAVSQIEIFRHEGADLHGPLGGRERHAREVGRGKGGGRC